MAECLDYLNSCLYLAIDRDTRKKSITEFQSCIILKSFKLAKFDLIPNDKIDKIKKFNLSIVNKWEEIIKKDHELDSIK
jgi:hypothetical protein